MPLVPRVTIGVPTYNRATELDRAVRSALAQTFADLEIVISDNASDDATPATCARLAASDPRVRIIRRDANVGLTANVNAVLREARGELMMVLADDDWLDPAFVEHAVAFLDAHPGHVLVSGSARYHRDGELRGPGVDVRCEQPDPRARVRRFFGSVVDNAAIYGLVRHAALEDALPMPNVLAGDWILVSRLLMAGRLGVEERAVLHRSVGGTSADFAGMARSMGLTDAEARRPQLTMARLIRDDIRSNDAYAVLAPRERRALARSAAAAMLRNRPLDVLDDLAGPVLRRPGLRRLDTLLRSAVRRVRGGGRGGRAYLP